MEDDHFVDPIQELRPELDSERVRHRGLHRLVRLVAFVAAGRSDGRTADVAGHDHDRVLEVDGPALAVGQAAVVEDLEQDIEHVGMGLLDLVEEDHLVGPPTDGLGQLAALLVADVAGWRADQSRDGELLHVLAHVDAGHRVRRRRT